MGVRTDRTYMQPDPAIRAWPSSDDCFGECGAADLGSSLCLGSAAPTTVGDRSSADPSAHHPRARTSSEYAQHGCWRLVNERKTPSRLPSGSAAGVDVAAVRGADAVEAALGRAPGLVVAAVDPAPGGPDLLDLRLPKDAGDDLELPAT